MAQGSFAHKQSPGVIPRLEGIVSFQQLVLVEVRLIRIESHTYIYIFFIVNTGSGRPLFVAGTGRIGIVLLPYRDSVALVPFYFFLSCSEFLFGRVGPDELLHWSVTSITYYVYLWLAAVAITTPNWKVRV